MLRSRNIPPLLHGITGDGITAALLVTTDGELLGSSSDADQQQQQAPTPSPSVVSTPPSANDASSTQQQAAAAAGAGASNPNAPDLPADACPTPDHAAIGALVAEVAADYRRMGSELLHLDPRSASASLTATSPPPPPPTAVSPVSGAAAAAAPAGAGGGGAGSVVASPMSAASGSAVGSAGGAGAVPGGGGGAKGGGAKSSGNALKCMILELDMGTVGVSSAGPECYVVALAEPTVQHGLLKARLMALSAHVAEALSQLAEQP